MSAAKKVAVVTGSNKGIGFAIVRALCKKFDGDVYLTSRDEGRGQSAVTELEKEGIKPKLHQLDIDDRASVERLRDFIVQNYGGLDVLVNNAGIAYKQNSTAPAAEQAELTVKTNFFSTLDACNILFPILKPGARVSIVSSMGTQMSFKKCSEGVQTRFTDPDLTMDKIICLMNEFVSDVKQGVDEKKGWASSKYGVSKMGVTGMMLVHAKQMASDSRKDIVVNCCCPGYVSTDMSSFKGHKTIDQGAEGPVYLALLPPGTDVVGKFIMNGNQIIDPWRM